jgi:SWI/SNF chromatin-remodeling complex subunit SWI1
VSDLDYAFLQREPWLSYLEKTIMAIYTIAFFSPPELKKRIKTDRSLCFSQVMVRLVQRFVIINGSPDVRQWQLAVARRAVEAMKAVDDEDDVFDTSQSTQPTLTFGMGFGDSGDSDVEKGTGLLASRRDAAWDLLIRDLDAVMFSELESLMRVEC